MAHLSLVRLNCFDFYSLQARSLRALFLHANFFIIHSFFIMYALFFFFNFLIAIIF